MSISVFAQVCWGPPAIGDMKSAGWHLHMKWGALLERSPELREHKFCFRERHSKFQGYYKKKKSSFKSVISVHFFFVVDFLFIWRDTFIVCMLHPLVTIITRKLTLLVLMKGPSPKGMRKTQTWLETREKTVQSLSCSLKDDWNNSMWFIQTATLW